MKNKYWICSEGVIWTLFPDGSSNYIGLGSPSFNKKENTIVISAFDGETDYSAWDSLTALAQAIEPELLEE